MALLHTAYAMVLRRSWNLSVDCQLESIFTSKNFSLVHFIIEESPNQLCNCLSVLMIEWEDVSVFTFLLSKNHQNIVFANSFKDIMTFRSMHWDIARKFGLKGPGQIWELFLQTFPPFPSDAYKFAPKPKLYIAFYF